MADLKTDVSSVSGAEKPDDLSTPKNRGLRLSDLQARIKQAAPEPITVEVQVLIPYLGGTTFCYLGSQNTMTMRYQTPNEVIIYGNLTLNWMLRLDERSRGDGIRISNVVTDGANRTDQRPPPGATKTYLQRADLIKPGQYDLQVVGEGDTFYLAEMKNEPYFLAIYSYFDEKESAVNRHYLQPSTDPSDNSIMAVKLPSPLYAFLIHDIEQQ